MVCTNVYVILKVVINEQNLELDTYMQQNKLLSFTRGSKIKEEKLKCQY